MINGLKCCFPIASGPCKTDGRFSMSVCEGTAFWIGGPFFLTAGHVLKAAKTKDCFCLGHSVGAEYRAQTVEDCEVLDNFDLGIVRATELQFVPEGFCWDFCADSIFECVQTMGFPFAFDPAMGTIHLRGFQGQVVGGCEWHQLAANPHVLELSFACPKGLSGAFLISWPRALVRGVIIGTSAVSMVVDEWIEQETSKIDGVSHERQTIVQNTLHLGIALHSRALRHVHSSLLGSTIEQHLVKHDLVAQ